MITTSVVHIIDDDLSVRESLEALLSTVGLVCRSYLSANQFLDARIEDADGCIILDVRLPGISGLDFQSQLARLGIELPVVMMTGYGDIPMCVQAMKAGALDFLIKPFRPQSMIDAVMAALECSRQRRASRKEVVRIYSLFETLSPREQQVMTLVTAGRMNKQVAYELDISEITVKIHRATAMRKMEANTLQDLVRLADILKLRAPAQKALPFQLDVGTYTLSGTQNDEPLNSTGQHGRRVAI